MSPSTRRVLSFATAFAGFLPLASAVSVIPSEPNHVRSLDGTWRFKLEQGDMSQKPGTTGPQPIKLPAKFEPFERPDYKEDATWHDFTVPGNWEMAGYSPATYNQPDNAIGLFRLEFDVPADWKGRLVKINFDGVQNGAEVYLNGQPVNVDEPSEGKPNFHQGGYNPFQADLTPHVKFGQKNLLAVRVYKNTKAVEMDSGDYFFLGGIHRTVTLFSVPATHLDDYSIRTTLLPDDKAEARALIHIAKPLAGSTVTMQIEGFPPVISHVGGQEYIEIPQTLDHPKLWSAEHPNLYTMTLDLKSKDGTTLEHISRKIGVREVSIENGVFMINHVPIKLAGICRHDHWPTLGSALGPDQWRKDIELMKAANINAIRTSHYPYGAGFYDLCDEMGMYVADEMAACWTPTDTDALTDAFGQHAREFVRRDKNHPSVVLWAIGNENKVGKNNKVAADEIRKLDDTRPRLVSIHKSQASEGNVEFDDEHYTKPSDVAKSGAESERRDKIPMIYLENPNNWDVRNGTDWGSLDRWAAVIDRTWVECLKAKHIPGTFLWEWQDRAVADKCPVKLYDFDKETGINLLKVKGLVGAYRDVRPDYYAVKVAFAPIKVDLKPEISASAVTVHATNHLSFTNLSELTTTWHLMHDGKDLQSAAVHPNLPPVSKGDITLDVPGDALAQADVLRLDIAYPDGRNMVTYDLRLKPEPDTAPATTPGNVAGITFPRFNFTTVEMVRTSDMWRSALRHPGKLTNIKIDLADGTSKALADDAALYALPLSSVRQLHADFVLADDKANAPVGTVTASVEGGKFSYHLNWTRPDIQGTDRRGKPTKNPTGVDVQELGWTFSLPAPSDHFSWHRKGYWSYYPADHIGRIAGTATPDSANQNITRITRNDAFDFISTKYDCDWASLADTAGAHGLVVKFAPDDRQHCRAGTAADGSRQLVVNKQASPPMDISSNVVPDYYLTLHKGDSVTASFTIGATGK